MSVSVCAGWKYCSITISPLACSFWLMLNVCCGKASAGDAGRCKPKTALSCGSALRVLVFSWASVGKGSISRKSMFVAQNMEELRRLYDSDTPVLADVFKRRTVEGWTPEHRHTFEAGKNLDTSRTESFEPANPNTDPWVVRGRSTACRQCAFSSSPGPLQFQLSRSMRHLMPIVTPRLILRPPTLGDLDSIQTAKEEAWPDLQRWMSWAFDNQRSRHAMEDSIRRVMDYQNQAGIALAGFHRNNGDFVVRTALDLTDEQDVYETGYWVAPKYAGQGMATEAANATIRYGFGHLGAKAISIGYFDGNEPSRRSVEKLGFQKVGVAHNAATRCLDGAKLDRHEYILKSPDALPQLYVSWG